MYYNILHKNNQTATAWLNACFFDIMRGMKQTFDIAVIGAGFYGCNIALQLEKKGYDVVLVESGSDLLTRASYNNQARVHNGYHYPMNITTALRSRMNFPRFIKEYPSCINSDFTKYYAIAKARSDVSADQFETFCQRIGAPIKKGPDHMRQKFNPDTIEEVFEVQEYAFDASSIRENLRRQIEKAKIPVYLQTEAKKVAATEQGLSIECMSDKGALTIDAKEVFNCTYAQINRLLHESNLPLVPLKYELTEMALVKMPPALREVGMTVMAGPFFSFMPFPSRPGLHTVSHVRYTPHSHWINRGYEYTDPYEYFDVAAKESNYPKMVSDIKRYFPSIEGATYEGSLWEIKTTLVTSEKDKGRPILYLPNCGLKGLHCIMGGKMDNIYDILDILSDTYPNRSTYT